MAKPRARKSRKRGTLREPLTISFAEAAAHLGMQPRTLFKHLQATHAPCLVPLTIGNTPRSTRYKLDRVGFFRWCRRLGFEGATAAL